MANQNWTGCGQSNSTPNSCVEIKADVVRYTNKVDSNSGWVQVKIGNQAGTVSLPKYTKVILLGSKSGRTYFKISDGHHGGKTAHMATANAEVYLGKVAPKNTDAVMTVTYGNYVKGWKSVDGRIWKVQQAAASIAGVTANVVMNSVWREDPGWDDFFPIPPGTYEILLPDAPHAKVMTQGYVSYEPKLKMHQVWFPIKFGDNSRYIHPGNVSDGCTTVIDLAKWEAIHEALISHRNKSGNIGRLLVQGKPERTN